MKEHKQQAFLNLYESCHDDFARYCSALTFGKMDVEDLMQEVLLSAYKHFDQIERKEQLLHYLIRAARNRAISFWRRAKFRPEMLAPQHESISSTTTTPETQLDVQILYKAMDKLPEKQRDALILFEVNGFSMKEIASMQQTSEGAVKTKISRGRKKLRQMMAERGKTPMFFGIPLSTSSARDFPELALRTLFEQSRELLYVPTKNVARHNFQYELGAVATNGSLQFSFFNQFLGNFASTCSLHTALFVGGVFCFMLPPNQIAQPNTSIAEASIGAFLLPTIKHIVAETPKEVVEIEELEATNFKEIASIAPPSIRPKVELVEHTIISSIVAPDVVKLTNTAPEELSVPVAVQLPKTVAPTPPVINNNAAYLYGKVTTIDGTPYIGQLRWGREEVFWTDYFDATKVKNENLAYLTKKQLRELRRRDSGNTNVSIIAINNVGWNIGYDFNHSFSCQFGELRIIERLSKQKMQLTLRDGIKMPIKSGGNDSYSSIHVYLEDGTKTKVSWDRIQTIEFVETPSDWVSQIGMPLHGTVESWIGEFDGLVIWDKEERLSVDILDGEEAGEDLEISFGDIRSIENKGRSCKVSLKDGTIRELSKSNDVNSSNDGIEVMIPDEGRVSLRWKDFERLTFSDSPMVQMKTYSDFVAPRALQGSVTTKEGAVLNGKLVYDLDERYNFEMLNGNIKNVEFDIPFRLVKSIEPKGTSKSRVSLKSGDTYEFSDSRDVNAKNTGVLVFQADVAKPVYIAWENIDRIDLE